MSRTRPQHAGQPSPRATSCSREPATQSKSEPLLREQLRAVYAYDMVAKVPEGDRKDYKIAVNDLGTNILRGGLASAMARLERIGERGMLLRGHIAEAKIPGLTKANASTLPGCVRRLDVSDYMLATREMLRIAAWLKRAVQATLGDD